MIAPLGIVGNEALRGGGEARIGEMADQQHPDPDGHIGAELRTAHPARHEHLADIGDAGAEDADEEGGAGHALGDRLVRTVGAKGAQARKDSRGGQQRLGAAPHLRFLRAHHRQEAHPS
jgi:hypothetical protein